MEKKATAQKFKAFMKKNVYYFIMALCLLAIAAMITVTVLLNQSNTDALPDDLSADTAVTEPTEPEPTVADPTDQPADNPISDPTQETDKPSDPTPTEPIAIVFSSPVASVDIACDYCMDSLVWNSTLKHYSVHNGIDFSGTDGTDVFCVYDGVVTSVTYDILNGYTVKIQHSDTLSSVYGSLNEPSVKVGQKVTRGSVIGTMGNTAGNEYSRGPHLHFSVYENGEITDPYRFMDIGEK